MDGTATLDDGTRLFRRLTFGTLAEISMLDLRTYRDQQVATPPIDPAIDDPERTITGREQLDWLKASLTAPVQWKLVGNPVMIAPVTFAQVPQALIGPVDDADRDPAARRGAVQRRPVGRLHRRPPRARSPTSVTAACATSCS